MQRILRHPAVLDLIGDKRTKNYNDQRIGLFPRPVKIGARASGWPEHEVQAVIGARIAGKSDDEIRRLVRELVAARGAG